MHQSLIDFIARETALQVMGGAVLQAIEENNSSGVFRKAKKAQVADASRYIGEDERLAPLVAAPSPAFRSLSKKAPIA